MAISAKYVGDLSGAAQPVLMRYAMNNSKMTVGDWVTCKSTGNTDGYIDIAVTAKGALGVVQGFIHADGRPVTANDAGGHTVLPASGGINASSVTPSADGLVFALVITSPTAVFSQVVATAPTSTTQYIGGCGDLTTLTSGAQTMEVVAAGTFAGKSLAVVPWNSLTGIDANDSTRLTVVNRENELFTATDTSD